MVERRGLRVAILAVAASPAAAYYTDLGGPVYGSSAYPNTRGHVHYENCCGHREFDVGLWNVRGLAGKTLTVYAGSQRVGTTRARSDGTCRFYRDTRNGQYVPTLSAGVTVGVRTGGGVLVALGTLRRMMMM